MIFPSSLLDASRPEPRVVTIQAKVTVSEAAQLDSLVDLAESQGVSITRSSIIRGFILSGLRGVREEQAATSGA